jgi:hypothetical protein
MSDVLILKENGKSEFFDESKLRESLLKANATVLTANSIANTIKKEIRSGMTSTNIYQRAFELLEKEEEYPAIKYSLKRSLLGFGPTGFPFEEYVAKILSKKGYQVRTGQVLKGKCVEHEVDVIAWNKQSFLIAEVKFHNSTRDKSDTRVALYIKARFDDLASEKFNINGEEKRMTRGILVTNTKFTENAKKYAKCVGTFDMISWEYPEKGNLHDLIEETRLHPITCIPDLSNYEKEELLKRDIVDCLSLKDNLDVLDEIGIKKEKKEEIINKIKMVCIE